MTRSTQKTQEDETLCEEQVLDWLEDETVPAGWSHRTVPGSRKVLVRDPSGRKYDGRRKALLHLLEDGEERERVDQAVSVLTAGLEVEGWRTEQSLPPGWRCRRTSREKKYLSENLRLFTSNIKALEFLRQNYDEATVEKFKNFTSIVSKRNTSSPSSSLLEDSAGPESDLTDSEDETVPAGWTSRPSVEGDNIFISPSGREFSSRLAGLRWLVESGAPQLELEELRQFLYYEQWQEHPDLPPGWRLKLDQSQAGKLLFLTRQAEVLQSVTEAASHLRRQHGGFSQDALIRLNSLYSRHQQNPLSSPSLTAEHSNPEETEKTLPPGWRLKVLAHLTTVEAPDGAVYRSRRAALQNMIETGRYSQAEVDLMRKFLKFERWTTQESLPSGWMMKRRKKCVLLMARDGMQFNSIARALEFVQTYSLYFDDDDIEKMKKLAGAPAVPLTEKVDAKREIQPKVRRGNSLNNSWTSDPLLPAGWKVRQNGRDSRSSCYVLSPSGEVFKSVRLALKHLIDSKGPDQEISPVREF